MDLLRNGVVIIAKLHNTIRNLAFTTRATASSTENTQHVGEFEMTKTSNGYYLYANFVRHDC